MKNQKTATRPSVKPRQDQPQTQRGALLLVARILNAMAMEIPEDRPFKLGVKWARSRQQS